MCMYTEGSSMRRIMVLSAYFYGLHNGNKGFYYYIQHKNTIRSKHKTKFDVHNYYYYYYYNYYCYKKTLFGI